MDLARIWAEAWRHRARLPDPLPAPFAGAGALAASLLGALPVRDSIGEDGDAAWEPIPIAEARPRDWRVIVAVRGGSSWTGPGPGALARMELVERARYVLAFGFIDPVVFGPLVDLVAVHPKRPARLPCLTGHADALGDPGSALSLHGPVRIARDLAEWVRLLPTAAIALPLGSPEAQAAYLRRCHDGVIGTDLAHGEALAQQLRRPVPAAPPVFVAAA